MPDDPQELHATLRAIAEYAGYQLSDEDFEAVTGAVDSARGRLAALRADVALVEEPAAVFSVPSSKARS